MSDSVEPLGADELGGFCAATRKVAEHHDFEALPGRDQRLVMKLGTLAHDR